jgi:hypothetical protein
MKCTGSTPGSSVKTLDIQDLDHQTGADAITTSHFLDTSTSPGIHHHHHHHHHPKLSNTSVLPENEQVPWFRCGTGRFKFIRIH